MAKSLRRYFGKKTYRKLNWQLDFGMDALKKFQPFEWVKDGVDIVTLRTSEF